MKSAFPVVLLVFILGFGAVIKYQDTPMLFYDFFKTLFWWLIGFWVVIIFIFGRLFSQQPNNQLYRNIAINAPMCLIVTIIAQIVNYLIS